jgi:L-lactate utilization protein LutC
LSFLQDSDTESHMTTPRENFLQRVRQAVASGNRPGATLPLEPRGQIGYQGGGPDPVARFREEFLAAGGTFHVVADSEAAALKVQELIRARSARRILLGRGEFLDPLGLAERLPALGVEVARVDALDPADRDTLFAADIGISGVYGLIAETGSLVVWAEHSEPRSLSLLPPVHIALAHRRQIIPDLFDLFEATSGAGQASLPSCLTLITGPSKTGDIELRLVTGVHGPGELHLVLIDGAPTHSVG